MENTNELIMKKCPSCNTVNAITNNKCIECNRPFNDATVTLVEIEDIDKSYNLLLSQINILKDPLDLNLLAHKIEAYGSYKDAIAKRQECLDKSKYNTAMEKINNNPSTEDLEEIVNILSSISEYKDSVDQSLICKDKIIKIKYEKFKTINFDQVIKIGDYKHILLEYACLKDYKPTKEKIEQIQNKYDELKQIENQNIKKTAIISSIVIAVIIVICVLYSIISPIVLYNMGNSAYESNNFKEAINNFTKSKNYSDSKEKLLQSYYAYGKQLKENDQLEEAIVQLELALEYDETQLLLKETNYLLAKVKEENSLFEEAATLFYKADDYENAHEDLILMGKRKLEENNYDMANKIFSKSTFSEAVEYLNYTYGLIEIKENNLSKAINYLKQAPNILEATHALNVAQAEYAIDNLMLNYALLYYNLVPQDYSLEGINVQERIALVNKYSSYASMTGTFLPTTNYLESKRSYFSSGKVSNWVNESILANQQVHVSAKINDSGTVSITGTVTYYAYEKYSSQEIYATINKITSNFEVIDAQSIPYTIKIDEYTTLNYSNGEYKLNYLKQDESTVLYKDSFYTTVTYK